jgi:hypothetical protein
MGVGGDGEIPSGRREDRGIVALEQHRVRRADKRPAGRLLGQPSPAAVAEDDAIPRGEGHGTRGPSGKAGVGELFEGAVRGAHTVISSGTQRYR